MTYGELITLLPPLANRSAGALEQPIPITRRAVKWAYNYLVSRLDLTAFFGLAEVDFSIGNNLATSGLNIRDFTDNYDEDQNFITIADVDFYVDDSYNPVSLITRADARFHSIIRPRKPFSYSSEVTPTSLPVAYQIGDRLLFHWYDEPVFPTQVRARVYGKIGFPSLLDSSGLNELQASARTWVLDNAENFLISKSLEFIQLYLKEDDRAKYFRDLAETELMALNQLESTRFDNTGGITLD